MGNIRRAARETTDRQVDLTPRVSVLTTVFDPEPAHLAACLASVDAQTFTAWEHVVVDDASTNMAIIELLKQNLRQNRRTTRRQSNGGIVAASSVALQESLGEIVVLVDHDDVLEPHALERVVSTFDAGGNAVDVVYSDHDILRSDGRTTTPVYKPDFSLERLRNHNYITHLVAARRTAVVAAGGFCVGFDGAQDHDLLLRLAETGKAFAHIPEVLLHWRQAPASVAADVGNKVYAFESGRRAVAAHLERSGIEATVDHGDHAGIYRIRRKVASGQRVSVIVPTRGSRGRVWGVERIFVHEAVASILGDPSDCEIEIVAVLDSGTDPVVERGLRRIAGDALRVVHYEAPFNFSTKINLGVSASSGDLLLLLNDDTEVLAPGSIDEMVALAQDPAVGMVGAKLLFGDGRLQHGGHVYNGVVSHALLGWPGDHPGPNRLLAVERECAGVTAAAALVPRSVHNEVGAMDPSFAINYNDVDYSLRIRATGRRIVWTPHACWYHFEHGSEPTSVSKAERELLEARWGEDLRRDPFYNPNLEPNRVDWLERPLMSGAPPYEVLPDGRLSWG